MHNARGLMRLVKSNQERISVMSSHYSFQTIKIEPPRAAHHHCAHSEPPVITLILLMATPTFISKSIDNYNYGEWLSPSLKLQRLPLIHAAGSVNGTIKIIDCTSPINKACFQLRAAIRLILVMEKPLFLHCSPFALFIPGACHILRAGFHIGLGSKCFVWRSLWRTSESQRWQREVQKNAHCPMCLDYLFNLY